MIKGLFSDADQIAADKLGRAKRQEQCCHAAHCEHFPERQILSADTVIAHWRPSEPSRRSRTLTVSDRSQILTRDPADNQYP